MDLQCAGLHYVTPGNTIKRHGKDGVSSSNLEVGSRFKQGFRDERSPCVLIRMYSIKCEKRPPHRSVIEVLLLLPVVLINHVVCKITNAEQGKSKQI